MTNRLGYAEFTYKLQPGDEQTIHRSGNAVLCLEADVVFKMALDNDPFSDFQRGLSYEGRDNFSAIRIKNPTDGEITVTIGIASGGVTDSRLSLTGTISARLLEPRTVESSGILVPPMTRIELLPRAGLRVRSCISNMGSEAVFIGGDTVSFGEGIPLGAGKAVFVEASARLHAYNQSTTAVPLAILEYLA